MQSFPIYGRREEGSCSTHCFKHKLHNMILHQDSYTEAKEKILELRGTTNWVCLTRGYDNPAQPNHPLCSSCHMNTKSKKTECAYPTCVQLTSTLYCAAYASVGITEQESVWASNVGQTPKQPMSQEAPDQHSNKYQSCTGMYY